MHYQIVTITMFAFLKSPGPPGAASTSSFSASAAPSASTAADRARRLCISSALEVARLTDLHRRQNGLDSVTVMMTEHITISLFILMEDLDAAASRAAFIELCVVARSFARRWTLGKGMLRLVQLTAQEMKVNLPRETVMLFHDFETRIWRPTDRQLFSSAYLSFNAAVRRQRTEQYEASLDQLLEKWDDLVIVAPEIPSTIRSGVEEDQEETRGAKGTQSERSTQKEEGS